MATLANYIPDTNRFKLAGPPASFLRQLHDYDPSLVIVPSRQGFFYRLAQRRMAKLSEQMARDVMKEQADTAMLARYGLVPVVTLMATTNWANPAIFTELTRRAPWRMGGAQQMEALVLGQDRQDQIDKAVEQDANLTDRAKDGWKYYNKKVGLRSHLYSPKTPDRRPATRGLIKTTPKTRYTPDIDIAWGNVLRKGQ